MVGQSMKTHAVEAPCSRYKNCRSFERKLPYQGLKGNRRDLLGRGQMVRGGGIPFGINESLNFHRCAMDLRSRMQFGHRSAAGDS